MAENAPPPFSTSQASVKSKRHSLNITSPSHRPLYLASSSILSSPSCSPSRSPALNTDSHGPVLRTVHSGSGPLSPFGVKKGRRQSSISYLSSNRDKNIPTTPLSPLSPTGFSRGTALASAAAGSPGVALGMEEGWTVTSSGTSAVTVDVLKQLKGRPPATVAEKHAELLHFIAQKESKCLELRSQLATHEAELLLLKRKWERIVNRGFDKTSSGVLPSPSTPPSSTASASYLYPSSLTTSAAGSRSGVVLDGIKEGVQGMGRFITAGLGSIAHTGTAESNTSSTTGILSPTFHTKKSSKFPVPLRLGSVSNYYGHESQSSSSTSASITTAASTSSTCATSFILESGTTEFLSPPFTSPSDEISNEFGDFREAQTRRPKEPAEQEESQEVLMVHDTGATPTMSPNPHFKRQNRMKVEPKDDISRPDFAWDDGWTTSGAVDSINDFTNLSSRTDMSSSSPVIHTVQPVRTKPPKIQTPTLPGASSIPGLASSSMSGTTPQSMTAWVGSVSKKWGEIRESQTFTKSQKRASILLSDVSQSIVSALISPSSLSASSRSVTASKSPLEDLLVTNTFHSCLSSPSPSPANAESTVTNKAEVPVSTSLLDDFDIGEEALKLGMGSPVLIPDPASKSILNPSMKLEVKVGLNKDDVASVSSSNSVDDEDWNW